MTDQPPPDKPRGGRTGGVPLSELSGSGATDRLHTTVREFVTESRAQGRIMIRLTWAIVVLTVVMIVEVAIDLFRGG